MCEFFQPLFSEATIFKNIFFYFLLFPTLLAFGIPILYIFFTQYGFLIKIGDSVWNLTLSEYFAKKTANLLVKIIEFVRGLYYHCECYLGNGQPLADLPLWRTQTILLIREMDRISSILFMVIDIRVVQQLRLYVRNSRLSRLPRLRNDGRFQT